MAHFSLPEEVLAELECSVCKVVQRDKAIFECQTGGHLYCGDCKTHLVRQRLLREAQFTNLLSL